MFLVLGYRDSLNENKKLPLNDNEIVDKNSMCWKLEEQRSELLCEIFDYVNQFIVIVTMRLTFYLLERMPLCN